MMVGGNWVKKNNFSVTYLLNHPLEASENFQYLFFLMKFFFLMNLFFLMKWNEILNFIPFLKFIVIWHELRKITSFMTLSIKDFLAKDLDKTITKLITTLVDFIISLI